MTKNSRKQGKAISISPGVPMTPPGWKGTGNLLRDIESMYGRSALNDSGVRARIRQEFKGQIEITKLDGEWRIEHKSKRPARELDKKEEAT